MERSTANRPVRPQSIEDIIAQAESFNFNPIIPFKHWVRAADTLFQEVRMAVPRAVPSADAACVGAVCPL